MQPEIHLGPLSLQTFGICFAFAFLASGALFARRLRELGKPVDWTYEAVFAALPKGKTDRVPLGGMGMHVSKYIPEEKQAEALNFIKWMQTPEAQKKWAQLGGVPARNDILASPEFLEAMPWNFVMKDSVPRLRDFWNLPEYAKLLNVHSTQVNAAINRVLVRRAIELLDPGPSERVADFFCGSGTTGVAAQRAGRRFLLVDDNPEAIRITRARLAAEPQRCTD